MLNNRTLGLHKAIVSPDLNSATVLTNEPWEYVDLFLARLGTSTATEARFYWQQAREFFNASKGLGLQSSPLCLYYSFMNATKSLLCAKNVPFSERHGVSACKQDAEGNLNDLTVRVKIASKGVLKSLSDYYNESEKTHTYTLSDIFFNLPYIHRTYSLTNHPLEEIFISLVRPCFVTVDNTTTVRVMAILTSDFPSTRYCKDFPESFQLEFAKDGQPTLLSSKYVTLTSLDKPTGNDLALLTQLGKGIREDFYYINGMETLWYVKTGPTSPRRIKRQSTTLTLAAMHRLSEECRYHPKNLAECLRQKNNWLVSEFIRMSGVQFIDEIAAEITGRAIACRSRVLVQ